MNDPEITIRRAKISDAIPIKELINSRAAEEEMLPRALPEVYSRIREFWVLEDNTHNVIGCVALRVFWADLAEVRSLVVAPQFQSGGFGKKLVNAVLNEAWELGVEKVFALTYVPGFFIKMGFEVVDKDTLPYKIWSDCVKCHKFPNCDEVAVIIDFPQK